MSASAARRPRDTGHSGDELEAILWQADPTTFQFTYVSPAAEMLFGFPLEDWLTRANFWIDMLHAEDRERTANECRRAIEARQDHELQYRARTIDGRVLWIRDLVRVALDEAGEVAALHGAMVDITARRLAVDRVLHAHSLQALARLASPPAPATPTLVDGNDELRYIEGALRQLLGVTVDLEMTLGASRSSVWLAPGQVQQIVLALAVNARDAMPAGGTLRIVTFDTPRIDVLRVPHSEPQFVIEVEDTGFGIAPSVRAHLLEPYVTTKTTPGAGLGLATIKAIVEEGNGHIEWASYLGHGTRFRIFLPLVAHPPAAKPR